MKCMWMAGVLTLVVAAVAAAPAGAAGNNDNAKLCQKDGWQQTFRSDGSPFANQGACVSYGAQGGSIITNAWQAACEQNGGTFTLKNVPPPVAQYECQPVSGAVWSAVLNPICIAYPQTVLNLYDPSTQRALCIRSGL